MKMCKRLTSIPERGEPIITTGQWSIFHAQALNSRNQARAKSGHIRYILHSGIRDFTNIPFSVDAARSGPAEVKLFLQPADNRHPAIELQARFAVKKLLAVIDEFGFYDLLQKPRTSLCTGPASAPFSLTARQRP
jgi:hypothetical protein